ncbi:MAG: Rne/Rng family ribonuclease [Candidatus Accumulibacter sp.]|jgi:ribonuclease E|nr:Rne/Rng family ribonuclease [Accumulibacter sp.]
MKRMLFNATQAEELRVAIVDGQKLIDLDIESATKEQRKSNIYKAVITRIEPSLEAAFVDYGAERHGFLPFKEISRAYFLPGVDASRANIREALREGQELIVQVEKDERGNKGAALTTFISLAGRYLVLMPNSPHGGGVSRRVEGEDRSELREIMNQLQAPNGMSLIVRTAAIGRGVEELQWDLNYLLQLWKAIDGAAAQQKGAFLIYQEGSLVIRAIRDYFQPDIGEILIDTDDIHEQARQFMSYVMPPMVGRIKRYRDDVPLFSRFQIEHQIESAYSRQVNLPSGGAIVIDHTEALVAIDVNSSRATRGADIEETAFKTNLEAAEEITRQLRLRDLGGLIIIDFIDMEIGRNQREVENRLREGLKLDRARVQTGKISRFGLLELSRQRLRPALAETSYIPCPRCSGTGHIRSAESAALHILRILEEEAMKDNTAAIHTQVPVDIATFLLNEKRADIQAIELRHKVNILLIPNIHLETPQHSFVRLRHEDLNQDDVAPPSYKMVEAPADEADAAAARGEAKAPRQEAAIKGLTHEQPAPIVAEKPKKEAEKSGPGLFARILAWFSGEPEPAPAAKPARKPRAAAQRGDARRGPRGNARRDEEREARPAKEPKEAREARATAAARDETAPKPRRPRADRAERKEKDAPPAVVVSVAPAEEAHPPFEAAKAPEEGNGGNNGNNRRRGRRGGRRERSEKTGQPAGQTGEPIVIEPIVMPEAATSQPEAVVVVAPLPADEPPAAGEIVVVVGPAPATEIAAPAAPAEEAPAAEAASSQMEMPLTLIERAMERAAALEKAAEATSPAEAPGEEASAALSAETAAEDAPEIAVAEIHAAEFSAPWTPSAQTPGEAPEAVPVPAEAASAPAEAAPPVPPPGEAIDIGRMLESSGLVMIETKGGALPPPPPEADEPAPPPRRRPRPAPAAQDEPLVMVETRRP